MKKLSLVLCGDNSNTLKLCDILLTLGHALKAVVGEDEALRNWCEHNNIPFYNHNSLPGLSLAVDLVINLSNEPSICKYVHSQQTLYCHVSLNNEYIWYVIDGLNPVVLKIIKGNGASATLDAAFYELIIDIARGTLSLPEPTHYYFSQNKSEALGLLKALQAQLGKNLSLGSIFIITFLCYVAKIKQLDRVQLCTHTRVVPLGFTTNIFRKFEFTLSLEQSLTCNINSELVEHATSIEPQVIYFDLFQDRLINQNFDACLSFNIDDNKFDLNLFCRTIIDRKIATQFIGNYFIFLANLCMDLQLPLAQYDYISKEEQVQIVNVFNHRPTDCLAENIISLLQKQVKLFPAQIALRYHDQTITYYQLDKLSDRLAEWLKAQDVQEGMIVPFVLKRGPEFIIAILGILKAKAAYLPIDPSYPADRISYILKDSRAQFCILNPIYEDRIKNFNGRLLYVNDYENYDYTHAEVEYSFAKDCIAYVIYTSGSTGRPKGVAIKHSGLSNLVKAQAQNFHVTPASIFLQFSSLSFDASVLEWATTLSHGGTLCLVDQSELSAEKLLQTLDKYSITIVHLPPSLLAILPFTKLPQLKTLIVGGEACAKHVLDRWGKDYVLFNSYGPTENTVCATLKRYDSQSSENNIGSPLANVNAYIFDKYMKLMPIGAIGELHLAGSSLAAGYLYNTKLTEASFVNHPRFPNETLYKTGDLARYLPNGELEYLGRVDQQIKLRGYRIELTEIEALVYEVEGIDQCVVLSHGDGADRLLIVYYTTILSQPLHEEIKRHLSIFLPEFMLPSFFINLPFIPLTTNGKVDKKALPPIDKIINSQHVQANFVAPRTAIEHTLAEIFTTILKVEKISIYSNFLDVGGNSLRAAQIIARINAKYHLAWTITELFNQRCIANLANKINLANCSTPQPVHDFKVERPSGFLPLSFAQQRLWFLHGLNDQQDVAYNIPLSYLIEGKIELSQLERAFQTLIERHEILRVQFLSHEGEPYQLPRTNVTFELNVENIAEADLSRTLDQHANIQFDLTQCAFKVDVYQISEIKYLLCINHHNIITDGWSLGILVKELSALYNSYVRNEIPNLPTLMHQYIDFSYEQRKIVSKAYLANQLSYWQEKMAGFEELVVPTDYARPVRLTNQGAQLSYCLSATTTQLINNYINDKNITLYMLLVAALKVLLARYSNQFDVTIGTGLAARNTYSLENIMGFFVNTLPLRTQFSPTQTFNQIVAEVRNTCLEAYTNQDVPFDVLVEHLKVERQANRSPLFQIMFLLQDANDGVALNLHQLRTKKLEQVLNAAPFDITFNVEIDTNKICFLTQYNTALYKEPTIKRLLQHYDNLLQSAMTNANLPIKTLAYLTADEINFYRQQWPQTQSSYPYSCNLYELFKQVALLNPNKQAVNDGDRALSYTELLLLANLIASIIKQIPQQTPQFVALYLERNVLLISAILGVLQAGCAFIPIDPDYPQERIKTMLFDASASIILTSEKYETDCSQLNLHCHIVNLDKVLKIKPKTELLPCEANGQDLAYMIYTSGSTGKPKGVKVKHHNVINAVYDFKREIKLHAQDTLYSVTSISFDIFQLEMWLPLLTASNLYLCQQVILNDTQKLIASIGQIQPTIMQATPTFWQVIAPLLQNKIKTILVGGEVLSEQVRKSLEAISGTIYNVYGPTETTIWSTRAKLNPYQPITIGKPLDNTVCYILDDYLQLKPIGHAGNLYISGAGVSAGYHQRDELNLQKFIKNELYPNLEHATLYQTGDLAKWNSDGNLEFIKRSDEQIKFKGYRIETQEISSILATHPDIASVVTLYNKSNKNNPENEEFGQLIAFVQLKLNKTPQTLSLVQVHTFLRQYLPTYMLPTVLKIINTFPVLPNGKLDKQALLNLAQENENHNAEAGVPTDPTEKRLARIWSEHLKIQSININKGFFHLGGHSLLIPTIVSSINHEFEVSLTIRNFIENITIAALAAYLNQNYKNKMNKSTLMKDIAC